MLAPWREKKKDHWNFGEKNSFFSSAGHYYDDCKHHGIHLWDVGNVRHIIRALAGVKEGFTEEQELVPDIRDDSRKCTHVGSGWQYGPCPSARRSGWLAALSQKARPVPIVLCHMLHLGRPLGTAVPIIHSTDRRSPLLSRHAVCSHTLLTRKQGLQGTI